MEEQTLNLLDLIYTLVERLMLTTEFDAQEIVKTLEPIRGELEGMRETYEEPAPEGTEALQELMLESIQLYDRSLSEIVGFLDDQDEDRLRQAVLMGEEASDILSAAEYVIQTNKHMLSEMVEA